MIRGVRARRAVPRRDDQATVLENPVELATHTVLLVRLLMRAVDRHAHDLQPGADEVLGSCGIERQAEVRAQARGQALRGRLGDHREQVVVQERLAPVVELDLPEPIAQLGQEAAIETQRQRCRGAADLTGAREAVGTLQVTGARRFDAQPCGHTARNGLDPVVLPGQKPQVAQAPPGGPGALEQGRARELPRQVGRDR